MPTSLTGQAFSGLVVRLDVSWIVEACFVSMSVVEFVTDS